MIQARTRLGIDLERHSLLRKTSPTYRAWLAKVRPAVHTATQLVALDESLTTWLATRIDFKHRPFGYQVLGLREYWTVLHTPPAAPGWLTTIGD